MTPDLSAQPCLADKDNMETQIENIETKTLIVIALRGVVVFPGITTSIPLSRKASIKAMKEAAKTNQEVFLVTQKDNSVIEPVCDDLHKTGVIAKIVHIAQLARDKWQIMVEGIARADLLYIKDENGIMYGDILQKNITYEVDYFAARRAISDCTSTLEYYLKFFTKPSEELLEEIKAINEPGTFADNVASAFLVKAEDKQTVLEVAHPLERLEKVNELLDYEIDAMELEGSIHNRVRQHLSKMQKEAYLKEQLRIIEGELGIGDGDEEIDDDGSYAKKISQRKLPKEIAEALLAENTKLRKMQFGSPEATVIRNYIEVCLELPWNKYSKDRTDIAMAKKILDEDHDGLTKVKERILEFMAVKQLSPELDGQIICLVGPPGVGKTSIAKSIAKATNRKYVRIALGGIRDEADIRGHRRTYIGSMPGRIINGLKLAGTSNPVMLLDEVDKLTADAHGDPTSALLEVLDSDQNKSFRDHFIELPIDLSGCLFIATANTTETIPMALLDRMEVIYMDSYSDSEKMSIAKNHLIPKQLKRHGLKKSQIRFTDDGINEIILRYTKESGVRNLEREIASICRKVAKEIVEGGVAKKTIDKEAAVSMLGPEKFLADSVYATDEVGIVNGLAWTQFGGDMLRIEALSMSGSGMLELTGSLGDVMKESARAAVSYIRKHAEELGIDKDFHKNTDIHIHVPEGAIPKDGPSAGITIATAIVSELSHKTVKQSIAMTGEITLTGRVLPIGGLKEKTAAAYKAGVKTVIIPKDNEKDLEEIDQEVRAGLTFIPVSSVMEVLRTALN